MDIGKHDIARKNNTYMHFLMLYLLQKKGISSIFIPSLINEMNIPFSFISLQYKDKP